MLRIYTEMFVIAITFMAAGLCGTAIAFTKHWDRYLPCLIFSLVIGIFVLLNLANITQ